MPPDPADSSLDSNPASDTISSLDQKNLKNLSQFRRIAFITTLLCYALVFIGGLVRVSGAGLGCPDWPKCYGRWIPPLSVMDIPPEVDPAQFNITLAWIEYLNRLAGVTVGLFIAATAFFALRLRSFPRILYPALLSLPLVAFLGWQGKDVVASSLMPFVVTAHLLIAVLLTALLTYATQEAWYEESSRPGEWRRYPQKGKFWIGLLALGTLSQIILGTLVRGELDTLATTYPLLTSLERYLQVSLWRDLHFWSGIIVVVGSIVSVVMLRRLLQSPSLFVRIPMIMITGLVIAELVLGVTMSVIGPQPLLQLYHLWGAVLLVAALVVLYSALAREEDAAPSGRTKAFRILAMRFGFAVLGMGFFASEVIDSAERSRTNLPLIWSIPAFRGLDQYGEVVTEQLLDDKITVLECIFTQCRGFCPPMGIQMKALLNEINYSDRVQILSFTVDPANDSPSVMREYLEHLAPEYGNIKWSFVNLGVDSIRTMCREGLLVSDDLPGMHSAKFMLVDQHRRLRGYYDHANESDMLKIRRDLAALVSKLDDSKPNDAKRK